MAITVNIYYKGRNVTAKKFAQEMIESGIADEIRAEEGNERYEYFLPIDNEETVLLIDRWKDRKSLDLHHASPIMKKITILREKYDLHMTVERYLSDESDITPSDEQFIRR